VSREAIGAAKKIGMKPMAGKLLICLLLTVSVARAQQPKKVPRLGYLSAQEPARESTRAETIRVALRELGYIEGQNIPIEYRYAEASS
jgi:putative ABC transport system substrate-binding protein